MQVGIKVGDVMTRNFIYSSPNTSIVNCVRLMTKHRVGSLVIKEGQNLKGMLTEGDIIWTIAKGTNLKNKVRKIMKKRKIRWLPVTIKKRVVGLLTLKDILKIQPALYDIASQRMGIAEEKQKRARVRIVDNQHWVREGPCHECGVYDLLYKIEDRYLCENCKKKLGTK